MSSSASNPPLAEFPADARPSRFLRDLWRVVRPRLRLAQGCCLATRTLASLLDCSARYVQVGLKKLRDWGMIGREFDYALKTRRRFTAAVPEAPDPPAATNSFGAPECAQSAHRSAPIGGASYLCLETGEEDPGIGSGPDTPPPPGEGVAVAPSPEAPPALVDRARKVNPAHPEPSRWIMALLKRWSAPWIDAALGKAEAKRGVLTSPGGYVVRTLEGFEAEGGPPVAPAPKTAGEREADREARIARYKSRMAEYEAEQAALAERFRSHAAR